MYVLQAAKTDYWWIRNRNEWTAAIGEHTRMAMVTRKGGSGKMSDSGVLGGWHCARASCPASKFSIVIGPARIYFEPDMLPKRSSGPTVRCHEDELRMLTLRHGRDTAGATSHGGASRHNPTTPTKTTPSP